MLMSRVINLALIVVVFFAQTLLFGTFGGTAAKASSEIPTEIVSTGQNVIITEANSISENGTITVSGTVQNASSTGRVIGLAAIGYDANNLPVETTVSYTKGTFGGKSVSAGTSESFTLGLSLGTVINRVEVLPTGNSTEIKMLGYGVYQNGTNIHVTSVVENGTTSESPLKLKVLGLNQHDEVIAMKEITSLNWMERPGNVEPGEPAILKVTLEDPRITKIKVDLPERVETTSNIINIIDSTGPKVILPAGNLIGQKPSNYITVQFNEEIAEGDSFDSISVSNLDEYKVVLSYDSLVIQIPNGMDFNQSYAVTIPSGAVKDLFNNPLQDELLFSISTINETNNIDMYEIINTDETWSTSRVVDKPVIIAPNRTVTIANGAVIDFTNDVIVYGKIINNGSLVSKTNFYANKFSFATGGTDHLNYGVVEGSGEFKFNKLIVKQDQYPTPPMSIITPVNGSTVNQPFVAVSGKTVPGFKMDIGNATIIQANDSGEFQFEVALKKGKNNQIITLLDVFGNNYSAKQVIVNYEEFNYVKLAIEAIAALPDVAKLTLVDKPKVIEARGKVNDALYRGASESEITNLSKLIDSENKLNDLEHNVRGTIKKGTVNVGNGYVNIQTIDESGYPTIHFSTSVENGKFKIQLPDGNYRVSGFNEQAINRYYEIKYNFQVSKGIMTPELLDIVIPMDNVTGSIQKGQVKVEKGSIYIQSEDVNQPRYYYLPIVNGLFSIHLPDGNYKVTGYSDSSTNKHMPYSYSFKVENGKSVPSILKIIVPEDNVKGSVQKGKVKIVNGTVYIQSETEKSPIYYNVQIENSEFSLYLPDGNYRVNSYYDQATGRQLDYKFTFKVEKGKSIPSILNIVIPADNVKGSVQKDSVKVVNGSIHIQNVNLSQSYGVRIENSEFSVYLPDGEYKVTGYNDYLTNKYVHYNYSFKVEKGLSVPSILNIVVPENNVIGFIQKGSVKVISGGINLYSKSGNVKTYYNYRIENSQFSMYLPDGTYTMDRYYDEVNQKEGFMEYTFKVEKGKSIPSVLNIVIPEDNVKGSIQKGSVKVTRGNVSFYKENENERTHYNSRIENGQFSMYLPDGTYTMNRYYDEVNQKEVYMTYTFKVEKGKSIPSALNIVIPEDNIKGSIQKGSAKVNRGQVNVYRQNGNERIHYSSRIENGQFSMYLPDGTYTVYGFYDEFNPKNVSVNYNFKVEKGISIPSVLNIVIPEDNVKGSIQKGSVKVPRGNVNLYNQNGNERVYYNSRIENGQFSMYLPDGTYTVNEYYDEEMQKHHTISYTFVVAKGIPTPTILNITIPLDNVSGTVQKGTEKVTKGNISLYSDNGKERNSYNTRIENGQFSMYLPDGTYTINRYYDEVNQKEVYMTYTFKVEKGKSIPSALNIVIPEDNVNGSIQKGSAKVNRGQVNVYRQNGNERIHYSSRIENGQFSMYLPDGTYTVEGYYDELIQKFVSVKYNFKVEKGKSDPNPLNIVIPADNVSGSIQKGSVKVVKGNISLFSQNGNERIYYNSQIVNGQFSMYLPDGTYTVNDFYDEVNKKQVSVAYTFKVEQGKSNPNPLNILIPEDNVTGSIQKGNVKVTKGNISLFSQNGNERNNYNTRIENGQFSMYLPDGIYTINRYYDEVNQKNVSMFYTFKVEKGKSNPNPLNIIIPLDNVTGSIQKGSVKVTTGNINLVSQNGNERIYYNSQIENGKFSMYLPDGTYTVEGYYDELIQKFVSVRYTFKVEKGKSYPNPLNIVIPADNVTGSIQKGSVKVVKGNISLFSQSGNEKIYYNSQIVNGQFSMYLPDGIYTVNDFYDEVNQKNVSVTYTFKVEKGKSNPNPLNIVIPADNVTGSIQKGSVKVTRGNVSLISQNGNERTHYNIQIVNGQFSMYLPDGTYTVEGYYDELIQKHVSVRYNFKVEKGKSNPNPLNIVIPADNVTGSIQKGSVKVAKGTISLIQNGNERIYFNSQIENGKFSMYLPDGTYTVEGYYDELIQKFVSAKYNFKVEKGKSNPNPLNIVIPADNVTGSIQKGSVKVVKGNISLFSQSGNERIYYNSQIVNGQFSMYLPDGTYTVNDFYDEVNQKNVSVTYTFNVEKGKSNPNPLNIVIPEDNVTGSIQKGSEKVKKGHISLYRQNGSETNYYNIQIENGKFSMYLPDGTYVVSEYYDQDMKKGHSIHYAFNVVKGKPAPTTLNIVIPLDNVVGTIQKGSTKVSKGSVNLQEVGKTQSYHARIENGKFSLYLPDGKYRIRDFYDETTQKNNNVVYEFIVEKGKSNPSSLNIVVPLDNVKGTLLKGTEKILKGSLHLQSETEPRGYSVQIENGQFNMYLPDGKYLITGYYDEKQKFITMRYSFTVEKGKTNPSTLNLIIKPDNVSGFIQRGTSKVQNGWYNISNGSNWYRVQIINGQFSMYLPDGKYKTDSYYDFTTKRNHTIQYNFTVEKGKSNPSVLSIIVPPDNVTGTIQLESTKMTNGHVLIQSNNGNATVEFSAILENDQFGLYLPDGKYKVFNYRDYKTGKIYQINYTFTVEKGKPIPSILNISITLDTTPPAAPVVNPIWTTDKVVTGKAEAGSTITVKAAGKTYTDVTKTDGTFAVTIPTLSDKTVVEVTAKDVAGNISKVTKVTVSVKDTTPPAAPVVNPIWTTDKVVTGKAEAGSTITVKSAGKTYTDVTKTDGTFAVTIPTLSDKTVVEVTAKDVAGNISLVTKVTVSVKDTTSPAAPVVNPIWTTDKVVTGKAEAGSTITVKAAGKTYTDVTKTDGTFAVTIPTLSDKTVVEVTAKDVAGNISKVTKVTVSKDTTPPAAPVVNPIWTTDKVVTGKAEAGSTISVKSAGKTYTDVTKTDGTFAVTIPTLSDKTVVEVTAKDVAGNISKVTKVTVSKDTTPPAAPVVNPIWTTDKVVTGKAEAGSTITVKAAGKTYTDVTKTDGTFAVTIPTLSDKTVVEVTANDVAGNISKVTKVTVSVKDTTPPAAPVVNPIWTTDKVVTGKAEAGSTITVKAAGKTYTDVTKTDGTFAVTIPTLSDKTVVEVTAKDVAGNISKVTKVTVSKDTTPPAAPVVNPIWTTDKVVTGKAEAGSTITVKAAGKTYTDVTKTDGTFAVTIPTLSDKTVVEVTAKDVAGNVSKVTKVIVSVKDTTAPAAPIVNPIWTTDKVVTGKAEAGSTVTVKAAGKTYTGVTKTDGTFAVTISTLSDKTVVEVTVKDVAGNISKVTKVTVSIKR
jgi:predicted DNA-binding protein with PD1-like motif